MYKKIAVLVAVMLLFVVGAPSFSQGDAITGAKGAVNRMSRAHSLSEMADCMTNESAGVMGIVMSIPIAMMTSMGGAMGNMASSMSNGKSKADPKMQAQRAAMKHIATDTATLMERYGLKSSSGMTLGAKNSALPPQIKAHGRNLLIEMDGLMKRFTTEAGFKDNNPKGSLTRNNTIQPEKLRYSVISPTRVAITDPTKPNQKIEARFEDGKWRIALPLDQLQNRPNTAAHSTAAH